jgi:hypothetical protein
LKVFLVGFDPLKLSRDALTAYFDSHPSIHNWVAFLPGQVFVVSDQSVNFVSDIVRRQFPSAFVFVSEVRSLTCDGWLPQQIWEFINNPVSVKAIGHEYIGGPAQREYYGGFTPPE